MIRMKSKGNFDKLVKYLEKNKKFSYKDILEKYGEAGVEALRNGTPKDTGLTAASWSYQIEEKDGKVSLSFYNSNIQNGVSVAVLIQYGHGTRSGVYVEGIDYINPSLAPVFDRLADNIWKEVKRI